MSHLTETETASRSTKPRAGRAGRRFGYVVAILVNGAMLYAVNRWPGWERVSFLTDETRQVIDLVNASIIVSVVANAIYLARDPLWLKALGDLLTTSVGLVALVRLWQVFPFDFPDSSIDWTLVARALLGLGLVGSVIAIVVAVVSLVRALSSDPPSETRDVRRSPAQRNERNKS